MLQEAAKEMPQGTPAAAARERAVSLGLLAWEGHVRILAKASGQSAALANRRRDGKGGPSIRGFDKLSRTQDERLILSRSC
jgi:hypothetical protein